MLKIYSLTLLFLISLLSLQATDYTIVTEGFTYSPAVLEAEVGDNITIVASGVHPTTEVSEETWNANGTTPLAEGFGTNTTSFTFTVESAGTIYYVCDNHVGSGMKGLINVSAVSIEEYNDLVSVDFGVMPITDNNLRYQIDGPENLVRSIEVISVSGRQVVQALVESAEGQLELNTQAGVYIVILKDKDGNLVFRESITLR